MNTWTKWSRFLLSGEDHQVHSPKNSPLVPSAEGFLVSKTNLWVTKTNLGFREGYVALPEESFWQGELAEPGSVPHPICP